MASASLECLTAPAVTTCAAYNDVFSALCACRQVPRECTAAGRSGHSLGRYYTQMLLDGLELGCRASAGRFSHHGSS